MFDVADDNFDVTLWEPLRRYLEGLGVRFHTGVSVTAVEPGFTVHGDSGQELPADGVVLATDVTGLRGIVGASGDLGDESWRAAVDGLGTAPPFLVHRIWLDRPVAPDRPAFLGTGADTAGQRQCAGTL